MSRTLLLHKSGRNKQRTWIIFWIWLQSTMIVSDFTRLQKFKRQMQHYSFFFVVFIICWFTFFCRSSWRGSSSTWSSVKFANITLELKWLLSKKFNSNLIITKRMNVRARDLASCATRRFRCWILGLRSKWCSTWSSSFRSCRQTIIGCYIFFFVIRLNNSLAFCRNSTVWLFNRGVPNIITIVIVDWTLFGC